MWLHQVKIFARGLDEDGQAQAVLISLSLEVFQQIVARVPLAPESNYTLPLDRYGDYL